VSRIIKFIGIYLSFSFIAAIGLLILSFPDIPESPKQWLILFVVALPVTIVGEFIGIGIQKNPLGSHIQNKTKNKEFSWLRIIYALIAMFVVFLVFYLMVKFFP
jgi:uncharacterized membrane protein YqgA involved in biofilm formation